MTQESSSSFFQKYFDYVGNSEAPVAYHRWSAISVVGALLGRQYRFPFGHFELYPTQFILLIGGAGSRKSSAIGIAEKLAKAAGYTSFADDRLSKEMFLKSMMKEEMPLVEDDDDLADLLDLTFDEPSEKYIVADEFLDFMGMNNLEFMTMLTKLWDSKDEYRHPKLHGDDVVVTKPTVNILAGSTLTNLTLAFPPEVVGHGFLTRMLIIQADPSGNKITWPKPPDPDAKRDLVTHLKKMKEVVRGVAEVEPAALKILDRMYKDFVPIDDPRFASYSNRRFSHLLKLCLVLAASRLSTTISVSDALEANTILHYAECRMPKGLGEFGKGRYSSVQTEILDIMQSSHKPLTIPEIWRFVGTDSSKQGELVDIMKGLLTANKIGPDPQGGAGMVAIQHTREEWGKGLILDDFLELEEM